MCSAQARWARPGYGKARKANQKEEMMKTTTYKLKVIFTAPVLGSQPTRDIATEYIARKNGMELPQDESEMLPEKLERGTTVFHRNQNGNPCLLGYHLVGFLKESARVQNGKVVGGVKNLRSKAASCIFIRDRIIPLHVPEDAEIEYCERPLRAETAMGPRVALARSEMLPEGTWFETGLEVLDGEMSEEVLRDLLDYGYFRGLCQWRGSGAYGNFRYELRQED
jgi:hypothetical protein